MPYRHFVLVNVTEENTFTHKIDFCKMNTDEHFKFFCKMLPKKTARNTKRPENVLYEGINNALNFILENVVEDNQEE